MFKDKHTLRGKKNLIVRSFVLLASVLLLMVGMTSTSLAFLIDQTPAVVNEFDPGEVTASITEDFNEDKTVKQDVAVQNTGNTNAYIRAKVVVTWQDSEGNIYAQAPVAGEDYTIEYNNNDWVSKAGYWYCKTAVAPGASTPVLVDRCEQLTQEPNDYHLVVEILADAIQSTPATAVESAWSVTVGDDGTIQ